MHRHTRLTTILAGPALLMLAGLAALPGESLAAKPTKTAKPTGHESVYRCKDPEGHTYVGQNIPEQCMNVDVEVLDDTGRVVRIIPGPASQQEVEDKKAAEAARIAAANRDKTLLATYLTVADIERLRDQRLELLVQQANVTEQYVANLKEREARLAQDVRRFRPYSDKPGAPALPDHIAEDIVNTVNGLQVYQQELAKNTAEQQRLRTEFASDITRFKELKGLK